MIGMSDSLAYGFTEAAAQMIDPNYAESPAINYYFLVASCIVLSLVGTFVTEKFMAPRFAGADLSKYELDADTLNLTPKKSAAVTKAVIATVIGIIVLVLLCIGDNPILGDPQTGSVMDGKSPFMTGIILTVTLVLFIPGAFTDSLQGNIK